MARFMGIFLGKESTPYRIPYPIWRPLFASRPLIVLLLVMPIMLQNLLPNLHYQHTVMITLRTCILETIERALKKKVKRKLYR